MKKKSLPKQGIVTAWAAAMRNFEARCQGVPVVNVIMLGPDPFDLLGKLSTKQVGMSISILAVMDAFTRDQIHTWLDEPLTSSEFKSDTPWAELCEWLGMKRNTHCRSFKSLSNLYDLQCVRVPDRCLC
jgi:hypothetical protein